MKDNFATITPGTTHDANLRVLNSPMTSERPQLGIDFDTKSDRGMVKAYQLQGAVVDTNQIADGAVTSDKIAQLTIATGDIANGAVTSTKISGTISNKLITGGTVGTALLGTCNIIGGSISGLSLSGTYNDLSLGSPQITGGTVGTALIGTSNIVAGSVGTALIRGGTVGTSVIGTCSIVGGTMGTSTIIGGTIGTALIGTSTIEGGTATSINLGTPLINAGTSGVTTLTEPRIGAILRQNITTNAFKPNTGVLTGWGYFVGNGTNNFTGTVTFGDTFSEVPIVLINCSGVLTGTTATLLSDFTGAFSENLIFNASSISTATFAFIARRSVNYGTGNCYSYTWMAIGQT